VKSRNVGIVDVDSSHGSRAMSLMQVADILRTLTNPTSTSSGAPCPGPRCLGATGHQRRTAFREPKGR
jgi:hypothetical protein